MKKILLFTFVGLLQFACTNTENTQEEKVEEEVAKEMTADDKANETEEVEVSESGLVDHSTWNTLLKKNVNNKGVVDYKGFKKDEEKLDEYLAMLSSTPPANNWESNETFAYWINAYNAFTVKLILDNEEKNIKSIKDIGPKTQIPFVNTPWDIKFIEIGGKKFDLNNIEHGKVRRKFDDPRYHFALVCAAESCPRLRNEAYTAKKLDKQLDEQGEAFMNSDKNQISEDGVKISPLFDWYKKDFEKAMPVAKWINKYSKNKVDPDRTDFEYMDYSWKLNGSF
ncbi:Protein of unknown function, DUF547 [Spirosomataceae bacterium TFI 002]|nr:Protein of unknown function, DUF547 [Spirosomataceae bacterium TFI 002]